MYSIIVTHRCRNTAHNISKTLHHEEGVIFFQEAQTRVNWVELPNVFPVEVAEKDWVTTLILCVANVHSKSLPSIRCEYVSCSLKISADIFDALTPVFLKKLAFYLAYFGMIKFYV